MTNQITLNEAFDYYLEVIKIKKSTKTNLEIVRTKASDAGLLDIQLNNLNTARVRKFMDTMSEYKVSYQYLTFCQLKSIVNTWLKDHEFPKISWDGIIKKPKNEQPEEGDEQFLTLTELKILLAYEKITKKQKYALDLFAVGALTGMAVCDLLLFNPKFHVTSDKKFITYRRTKTGNRCVIPMLPLTQELISKHTWPAKIGKRMFQSYCENKISELAGKKLTSHSARKTAGAILLELGFSIESTAAALGHSDSRITQQIYARCTRDKIQHEMDKVNKELLTV